MRRASVARHVEPAARVADRRREHAAAGAHRVDDAVDDGRLRRAAGRCVDREVCGHDRAERVGRGEIRDERLRDLGRHGEHDRVARREIHALAADRDRIDRIAVRAEFERVEPRVQPDLRAAVLQHPQRRFDEGAAETVARDERPAAWAARGERATWHRARELGARVARLDVQHPEEIGAQPTIPQHAVTSHRSVSERPVRANASEASAR